MTRRRVNTLDGVVPSMGEDDQHTPPADLGEHVRVTALRLALAHSGSAASALIDMSAALYEAESPGLARETDYLADRIAAVAGEIAIFMKNDMRQAVGHTNDRLERNTMERSIGEGL